jgi:hypothetical protein
MLPRIGGSAIAPPPSWPVVRVADGHSIAELGHLLKGDDVDGQNAPPGVQ